MTIIGTWDAAMKTPIGTVKAVFEFRESGGLIRGTAEGSGDTVEMRDVVAVEPGHYSWSQTVNKPMRLNLEFDVRVDGDELRGTSRAGRLPRSAVTGMRRVS